MKTYNNLEDLYKDWLTTKELFKVLKGYNYAHNKHALIRWEKAGVIPPPKRQYVRKTLWRVYSKDGTDFEEIIQALSKRPRRLRIKL